MWLINDAVVRVSHDFIDNSSTCDSGNRGLACRIHIRDHHPVRIIEGTTELSTQGFCPRKTVRLKHRDETPPTYRFGCAKCGTNFRGMVRVIVDEQKPVARVFDLEPAPRMLEFLKRCRDLVERNRKLRSQRDYSKRIMHVVFSGNIECRPPEFLAVLIHQKG